MQQLIDDHAARANVLRLAAGQALARANSTVIMTTGAIVGSILAPKASPATLPVSWVVFPPVAVALAALAVTAPIAAARPLPPERHPERTR